MEKKSILPPMHLRKKGVQGVNSRVTIETIHRGPLVAELSLPLYTRCDYDKKREQTLRENRRGRWEGVDGHISHQLVLCLVQPVHEFGVASDPIIRGHRAAFLWDLELLDRTCPLWRLASAGRCRRVAADGSRIAPNVPQSPGYCWPTPRCRNLGVQHACFEGKKAGETSPRKSTPRTLKEVDQQYPPVKSTVHSACLLPSKT